MEKKEQVKKWEGDFVEFLDSPAVSPPTELSKKVLGAISAELNPSVWKVFTKLIAVVS